MSPPRLVHPARPTSPLLARIALGVAVAAVLLVAGCGDSDDRTLVAGGAPQTAPPTTETPPTTSQRSGPATLVTETLNAGSGPDGSWRAAGLVRNEQAVAVDAVGAQATLLAADGRVLAVVSADSPVAPVLAGEVVPVALDAPGVAASDVADIDWQVGGGLSVESAPGRDLAVGTHWTRPAGDSRPVDFYLLHESPGGPHPFVLFGSVTTDDAVTAPGIVFAWSGADGRIIAVRDVAAVDAQGAPIASLPAGGSADVLVIVDDPTVASQLDRSTPMTWTIVR